MRQKTNNHWDANVLNLVKLTPYYFSITEKYFFNEII